MATAERLSRRGFVRIGVAVGLTTIAGGSPLTNRRGEAAETTLARIKRSGTIRVGYYQGPPNSFMDQTGSVVGESPSLARHISEANGIKNLQGVRVEFGGLIPGLQANQIDIIAIGLYIKPKRCEVIAFSNPTYQDGSGLAVKAGNALKLHSFEDVAKNSQVRLGGTEASFEIEIAKMAGVKPDQITQFPTDDATIEGLLASRVDAVTSTRSILRNLVLKINNRSIQFVDDFSDPIINGKPMVNVGGFAFRKEDNDLREMFDKGIAEALASGWQLQILKKWGFTEKNLPPKGATAEQYCRG